MQRLSYLDYIHSCLLLFSNCPAGENFWDIIPGFTYALKRLSFEHFDLSRWISQDAPTTLLWGGVGEFFAGGGRFFCSGSRGETPPPHYANPEAGRCRNLFRKNHFFFIAVTLQSTTIGALILVQLHHQNVSEYQEP